MIKIRTKKIKVGYSIYLDYNCTHPVKDEKSGEIKHVRKVEFLNLYVTHDYTKRKKIESQDRETWDTAIAILKKRELASLTNDRELIPKNDNASFIDFFRNLLSEKKNHRTYVASLNYLIAFSNNKLSFRQVNKDFIFSFQNYLQRKVSQNSVIIYIKRFQIIWNIAIKREIIQHNPFMTIDNLKKLEPEHTHLTFEELQMLIDNSNEIKPIIVNAFLFSCFTGLRYSDIKNLKWEDIKDNTVYYRQQKTNRLEVLPLSKQAIKILTTIEKKEIQVFKGLSDNSEINKRLKVWAKQAKIGKNLHFHVARHTFATLSLASGIDLYTVSKLVGHSNITQTQIYAKIIDEQKREAVNKLPELKSTKF